MKIYQLKQRPEVFKTLTLDIMNLANQLGNKKLVRQLRLQPSTNEPLLPIWKDGVVGDFEDVLGKNSTMPDISTWYSTYLALTAGACDKLGSVLASEGEFLPINVGDETIYAFNCLSFGAEDESMCLKKYTDGFEDGLETIEFAEGLEQIAALPDPVGEVSDMTYRPSGIQLGRMRVPLGVVGIIYESRPNVTADAAALCLKSGNATILRGGSEAIHSNQAIAACIRRGLEAAGLPDTAVQVVQTTDRAAVGQLISMPDYVDVIVPRGGKGLIERISQEARVPVIKHLDGICHVFIDCDADLDMAEDIAVNAKCHRYGVCNAMETLLVHKDVAEQILPRLAVRYADEQVELRGCTRTRAILADINAATDEDWDTEYLAPILSIKVVDGLDAAMEHIHLHSSGHTESIVTENYQRARRFLI